MKVKKYNSQDKKIWDEFVNLSKNKHFFFIRDYMEYHSERFDDYSLMVYTDSDKLIALLPANIENKKVFSHQGLTFGGLIFKSSIKQKEVCDVVEAIVSFLKGESVTNFLYKKMPYIYHLLPSDEDLYPLLNAGFKVSRRDVSSSIKISNQIKYSKGRKWIVKKANSHNLSYSESNDIREFWDKLSGVLMTGHGAKPVHTCEEIVSLKEKFPEQIKFYSASLDGVQIAGAVIFLTDTVAHTQYLYNTDEGREVGALDGLIDYLVKEKFKNKEYFDFGTSNENQGKDINSGLVAQKEGFGARVVVHDFYEIKLDD